MPESTPYELTNGVAVLDIEGAARTARLVLRRGLRPVAGALTKALADARVASVLLRLNSPGGAAAGRSVVRPDARARVVVSGKARRGLRRRDGPQRGLRGRVRRRRDRRPETGEVGSVGVIASIVSRVAKNRWTAATCASSLCGCREADGHPDLPLDDAAIARFQADVNALAGVFYRWVGDRRRCRSTGSPRLKRARGWAVNAVAAPRRSRARLPRAARRMQRASTLDPAPTTGARSRGNVRTHRKNTMDNEALVAEIAAITGRERRRRAGGRPPRHRPSAPRRPTPWRPSCVSSRPRSRKRVTPR